jgi:hypothetical protein
MDQRDQKLLEKQLGRLNPAPRPDGVIILMVAATFFAGLTLGGVLFARQSEPLTSNAATVISLRN